jgi:hypothetical protein
MWLISAQKTGNMPWTCPHCIVWSVLTVRFTTPFLEEEYKSSKAGYTSSTQAQMSLSFKTKVPGIFGGEKVAINGHPFAAIDSCDKWVSTGLKNRFRAEVEDATKALKSTLSIRMVVRPDPCFGVGPRNA